jgi:hypothetical protein
MTNAVDDRLLAHGPIVSDLSMIAASVQHGAPWPYRQPLRHGGGSLPL